jgi:hypothetical protein
MDDYLTKPLDRSKLNAILANWLARSPYRDAVAPVAAAAPVGAAQARSAEPFTRQSAATRPTPAATAAPARPAAAPMTAAPAAQSFSTASGPALASDVVEDLREVMGGEFLSLIRVFLEDTPRTLERLQAAAETGDMSELARQIEHGGRAGTLAQPQLLVARLVAEFLRVESALRALLS